MAAIGLLLSADASFAEPLPAGRAAIEGDVLARSTRSRVPGAAVVLQSAAGRFETTSDATGHYLFPAVPAGAGYSLTAEHAGFVRAVRSAIRVLPGQSITLDVELDIQTLNQTIVVGESAAEIPVAAPEISRTVTAGDLGALPSNGRSLTRFALLDPHVRQTQGLASDGAAASRLSINGSSFRHTGHMLDGVSNYDSVFANAPQQAVSVSAVQELKVLTNQYSAEYGGSAAGVLAATTRSGGDRFNGELFAFLRPSGIQARPPVSSLRVPNEREQYGASAGGPILSGRTNFFANFEGTRQTRGSYIQSPVPSSFTGELHEWFSLARIDHRLNDRHALTLRLNGQHSANDNSNDRIGGFTQPSAVQLSYNQAAAAQATERYTVGRLVNEARAAYTAYTPSATRTPTPAVSIIRPSYSTEGGSTNSWVHARSAAVSDLFGIQAGAHEIRAGGDIQRQKVEDYSFTPFGEYRFAAGPPQPGATPLQYTQTFGQAMLRYGQTYGSLFVQDNWKIAPRLTANLGLRYERQSITDDRNNFAPRLGISWDVAGNGKTVLRGGAGIFYDQYYFYIGRRFLLQGVDSPTTTVTLPYGAPGFPAFPDSLVEPPSQIAAARRDLYLRPATVLNPYSLQYSIGIRQDLGGDWVLTADALHTHTLKQMRARDINAPAPFVRTAAGQRRTVAQADATRPFATYAGVPVRNVLVIENSGSSLYDALDLGLARRFSKSWQFQAHYVYSSSSTYAMFFGEPNTGIPNDWSNTGTAERGPSDFYQRHRVTAASVFELPGGVQLSLIGNAGSGLPVNPVTGTDNNGDTFLFDRPAGVGRNSFRGPFQAAIDTAAAKRFPLRDKVGLEVRAEAFNLLNRNNYLKLNGIYGDGAKPSALFMTPVAGLMNADPSRQFQLAVKLFW